MRARCTSSGRILRDDSAFLTSTSIIPRPCSAARKAINARRRQLVLSQARTDTRARADPVWEKIGGCDVVLPSAEAAIKAPPAVVHFAGGFGAGIAPRALYGPLLEEIAARGGVAIVATPVGASFDHLRVAKEVAVSSYETIESLRTRWQLPWIPVVSQNLTSFRFRFSRICQQSWRVNQAFFF